MSTNLIKVAQALLTLKDKNNYKQFNKGFFKKKPELEGYYVDLSKSFKHKVYMILSNSLEPEVKYIQDNIFITFKLDESIEEFTTNLEKKSIKIMKLLEQVVSKIKQEVDIDKQATDLPVGYYRDENNEVKVHKEKANLVRKIFSTYAQLRSMRQVERIVGSTLPYEQRVDFTISAISKILHDKRYTNMRPNIVSGASYNQAQQILQRNRSQQLIHGKYRYKKK